MRNFASTISLFLLVTVLRADCPTPTVSYSWQVGLGVSYNFPDSGPPPPAYTNLSISALGIGDDISAAFSQWSYANQSQNSSNVGFYFSNGNGPFRVYAKQVNYPGVPFQGDPGAAAVTEIALIDGTNLVSIATTTFYYGSLNSGYPVIDPSRADYHTFIQKAMRHEIGHTMGLAEQPTRAGDCAGQIAGESVMNTECGTNDSANNMPAPAVGVPACDNASVP